MGARLHPPRLVLALQVTAATRAVGERKFSTTTTSSPGIKGAVPRFSLAPVAKWVCSLGMPARLGFLFLSEIFNHHKILGDYLNAIISLKTIDTSSVVDCLLCWLHAFLSKDNSLCVAMYVTLG